MAGVGGPRAMGIALRATRRAVLRGFTRSCWGGAERVGGRVSEHLGVVRERSDDQRLTAGLVVSSKTEVRR